jgi:hypothetical protein
MSTFLKLLPMELSVITKFSEPTREVKSTDTVIGTIENDHKALYTLWLQTKKAGELKTIEANYETDPEEKERLNGKAYELGAKAQALYELLWIAINDHFEVWPRMHLRIRKGWQLVQTPPPKQRGHSWPFIIGGPMSPEEE